MASTLNIFYQIFSLNYSTEEFRENFNTGCNLAVVGSKDNVSAMLELLGEPVINLSNINIHSQICCLPLPDRRNSTCEQYKNIDAAIIHLGNAIPSSDYLRFCCECFPAKAKLLFLTNNLNGLSLAEMVNPNFKVTEHAPTFVSDAEATHLAAKALAQAKQEQEEASFNDNDVKPAWMAAEQSVTTELQRDNLESIRPGGAELEKSSWATDPLASWTQPEQEPRLGPGWRSSDPLASYIVSPVDINIVELESRFDSTLPPINILKVGDDGASFYECLSKGLGNWIYTLARDYSLLRENIVSKLITSAAKDSAIAAMASGATTSLPFVGAFLGLFAVSGETIYITAKQLRLALLIGAIYGRPIDFFARIGELLPVVGGAWGWRILAREAVGFIPALGAAAKAAIAWSGTYTVGKLSQRFYQMGEQQISSDYREYIEAEAKHLAKQAALDCFKSKP